MSIKDLWNRLLARFRKKEDPAESAPVMELVPEEAPEPVPERKTSDEVIIEMAEGTVNENGDRQIDEPADMPNSEPVERILDPAEESSSEKPAETAAEEPSDPETDTTAFMDEVAYEEAAYENEEDYIE